MRRTLKLSALQPRPLARFALLAAATMVGLLVALQPTPSASAQGALGGTNFIVISCAASVPDPICSPANGTVANPASRDVAFLFDLGTLPNQTYTLLRITLAGGSNDAAIPVVPIPIGTIGLVRDTVPAAAGQVVCYQLLASSGGAAFRSDFECVVFGLAQGVVPAEAGFALRQTDDLTVTWQPVAGAATYLVYSFGTDGVQVTQGTSATLQGTGGLICGAVIPINAQSQGMGASNMGCGFPNNFGTTGVPTLTPTAPLATLTRTATPSISATPTRTGTPTPTTTTGPTSTATRTPTITATPTITLTSATLPDLTVSVASHPTVTTPGDVVTYTLTVANQGGTTANGITVQNNLPPGVALLSSSGTNGFTCGQPVPSGVMACTGGVLAGGGAATIDLVVFANTPCVTASPFVDTAIVNPNQTIVESNFGNNSGSAETTVLGCPAPGATVTGTATPTRTPTITAMPSITGTSVAGATSTATGTPVATVTPTATGTSTADLSIVILDAIDPVATPGPTSAGQITYTVVVVNTGASPATGVTVIDTLENGAVFTCGSPTVSPGNQCNTSDPNANNVVTFVSASGNGGFVCAPSTTGSPAVTDVVCTGGTVPASSGTTISITVSTTPGCSYILNRAVADPTSSVAESNEANNVGYAQTACGAGAATPTPLATLTATAGTTATSTLTPDTGGR
jgi:uncharacterized repeat protein (TIGR01451 family)